MVLGPAKFCCLYRDSKAPSTRRMMHHKFHVINSWICESAFAHELLLRWSPKIRSYSTSISSTPLSARLRSVCELSQKGKLHMQQQRNHQNYLSKTPSKSTINHQPTQLARHQLASTTVWTGVNACTSRSSLIEVDSHSSESVELRLESSSRNPSPTGLSGDGCL